LGRFAYGPTRPSLRLCTVCKKKFVHPSKSAETLAQNFEIFDNLVVESILLCGLKVDLEISVEILGNYFVLGSLLGQIQKLCEIVSQKSLYTLSEICRNLMISPQNFISFFRKLNFMMF
jgi:hypothetical protein